jgi:hypothetical protein
MRKIPTKLAILGASSLALLAGCEAYGNNDTEEVNVNAVHRLTKEEVVELLTHAQSKPVPDNTIILGPTITYNWAEKIKEIETCKLLMEVVDDLPVAQQSVILNTIKKYADEAHGKNAASPELVTRAANEFGKISEEMGPDFSTQFQNAVEILKVEAGKSFSEKHRVPERAARLLGFITIFSSLFALLNKYVRPKSKKNIKQSTSVETGNIAPVAVLKDGSNATARPEISPTTVNPSFNDATAT